MRALAAIDAMEGAATRASFRFPVPALDGGLVHVRVNQVKLHRPVFTVISRPNPTHLSAIRTAGRASPASTATCCPNDESPMGLVWSVTSAERRESLNARGGQRRRWHRPVKREAAEVPDESARTEPPPFKTASASRG
jgi:hypothetical protein